MVCCVDLICDLLRDKMSKDILEYLDSCLVEMGLLHYEMYEKQTYALYWTYLNVSCRLCNTHWYFHSDIHSFSLYFMCQLIDSANTEMTVLFIAIVWADSIAIIMFLLFFLFSQLDKWMCDTFVFGWVMMFEKTIVWGAVVACLQQMALLSYHDLIQFYENFYFQMDILPKCIDHVLWMSWMMIY